MNMIFAFLFSFDLVDSDGKYEVALACSRLSDSRGRATASVGIIIIIIIIKKMSGLRLSRIFVRPDYLRAWNRLRLRKLYVLAFH